MASDHPGLEHLIGACAEGDARAFKQLYDLTSSQLFGAALRILGDRQLAEDVVQEAYIQIWRNAERFAERKGSAKAWLLSILRYRAIDLRRRKIKLEVTSDPIGEEQPSGEPSPEAEAILGEESAHLHRCLEELGGDQMRSIRLAYHGGLTQEEVSQTLGAPLGTVKSWMRRGLQALKECLSR
jgi:RNA polymerase sigma-70 factor (ECF subfamily)